MVWGGLRRLNCYDFFSVSPLHLFSFFSFFSLFPFLPCAVWGGACVGVWGVWCCADAALRAVWDVYGELRREAVVARAECRRPTLALVAELPVARPTLDQFPFIGTSGG